MFELNAKVNAAIGDFVKKIIYHEQTDKLTTVEDINAMDRTSLARQFIEEYFSDGKDVRLDEMEELESYAAKRIDRLIPRTYFFCANKEALDGLPRVFIRRIFNTLGKDGFNITAGLQYYYDHDFSKEKDFVKRTEASSKQLDYLKELGEVNGFQLRNEHFLSKQHASFLINYLRGDTEEEPVIFPFFFVEC